MNDEEWLNIRSTDAGVSIEKTIHRSSTGSSSATSAILPIAFASVSRIP
jgi:hypothetical protein